MIKRFKSNSFKFDTSKVQLTIAKKIISSLDNEEKHLMHSKSGNMEIMINDKADKVIEEFLIHLKIDIRII